MSKLPGVHVFEERTTLFKVPEMNERCLECEYCSEREPGCFIGAMYLGYGLVILEGILAFLFCSFLLSEMVVGWIVLLVTLPMFLLAKKNFKWSSILYIHIFPW